MDQAKGIADGEFPLLDRVKLALPIQRTSTLNAYAGDRIGIDTEKFGYFALSILWRAAVQRWRLPDGRLTQQIAIGELEDQIRKYLLSEADFPQNVVVLLTICLDAESRGTFYPPALRRTRLFSHTAYWYKEFILASLSDRIFPLKCGVFAA